MGRNAGTQMFWTHAIDPSGNHTYTYYCQQHAKWAEVTISDLVVASNKVIVELGTFHGNVKQ